MLGRAIVRDSGDPEEAARRLALMNLMVAIGPGVAPMIGAALAASLGWRSIFCALCALGVVNFICTWRLPPETGRRDIQANTGVGQLARNHASLLNDSAVDLTCQLHARDAAQLLQALTWKASDRGIELIVAQHQRRDIRVGLRRSP